MHDHPKFLPDENPDERLELTVLHRGRDGRPEQNTFMMTIKDIENTTRKWAREGSGKVGVEARTGHGLNEGKVRISRPSALGWRADLKKWVTLESREDTIDQLFTKVLDDLHITPQLLSSMQSPGGDQNAMADLDPLPKSDQDLHTDTRISTPMSVNVTTVSAAELPSLSDFASLVVQRSREERAEFSDKLNATQERQSWLRETYFPLFVVPSVLGVLGWMTGILAVGSLGMMKAYEEAKGMGGLGLDGKM